jgi:hypothetical protein
MTNSPTGQTGRVDLIDKPGQVSLNRTERKGGHNMTGRTGLLGKDNRDRINRREQPVQVSLKVNLDNKRSGGLGGEVTQWY